MTAEITGPEHSAISVIEEATLNGSSLHAQFTGYTPDLGDAYAFTPRAIAEEGPPVAFEYDRGGETIPGRVEFTAAPISIGSLFDFDADGALQDLVFDFHLAGGDTINGVVEYGSLDIINPLDCNGDGVVDGGDLACILGFRRARRTAVLLRLAQRQRFACA